MAAQLKAALKAALKTPEHHFVAKLFNTLSKKKIICTDIESGFFYYFSEETSCYKFMKPKALGGMIREELLPYLEGKRAKLRVGDAVELRSYDSLLRKVANEPFIQATAAALCHLIYDGTFVGKLNSDKDTMSFKNGLVNLRTKEFRLRTPDDFVSNPWQYLTGGGKKKSWRKAIAFLIFPLVLTSFAINFEEKKTQINNWTPYCCLLIFLT
jgi:hypothetical protein